MSTTTSPSGAVLVSGCFDLLHSGHVMFLETAAGYGRLHVCVGADDNVQRLKGQRPRFNQEERLYMVRALRCVHRADLASGSGLLDFAPDMERLRPEVFVVNHDGDSPDKQALCERLGVRYVCLPRVPRPGLPARSSTTVKQSLQPPYRLCLAGGWLDQPFVSQLCPGAVIVAGIEPTRPFNLRSGLATSTRRHWERLWRHDLFPDDPVELAKLLFGYENPPGSQYISGSQDALGLTLPGVNRLYYEGGYWPQRIDSLADASACDWLERHIRLVELFERPPGYDPLSRQNVTPEGVRRLADAAEDCWRGIRSRDLALFGRGLTRTHDAWREILPLTTSPEIDHQLDRYVCAGRITTGSGGGYIVLATDQDVPGSFGVRVRRQP